MAKRISADAVRKELSADLIALALVLEHNRPKVIKNSEVLKSSANQVKRKSKKTCWSYEVADLWLNVDLPQNVLPSTCGESLDILINLDLKGECSNSIGDSLTHLTLQITIETDTKQNICSWHFDRHIGESDAPSEAHPLYHFQHGGHAMKIHADSLGKTLVLPAPRIAFPPMDAILSIDFVLSNFAGSDWKKLRSDPAYAKLLKKSQVSYWKPYAEKIASWWAVDTLSAEAKSIEELWPNLM